MTTEEILRSIIPGFEEVAGDLLARDRAIVDRINKVTAAQGEFAEEIALISVDSSSPESMNAGALATAYPLITVAEHHTENLARLWNQDPEYERTTLLLEAGYLREAIRLVAAKEVRDVNQECILAEQLVGAVDEHINENGEVRTTVSDAIIGFKWEPGFQPVPPIGQPPNALPPDEWKITRAVDGTPPMP
jgi:hypothetical protein